MRTPPLLRWARAVASVDLMSSSLSQVTDSIVNEHCIKCLTEPDGAHVASVPRDGGIQQFAVSEHLVGRIDHRRVMGGSVAPHVLSVAGDVSGWTTIAIRV